MISFLVDRMNDIFLQTSLRQHILSMHKFSLSLVPVSILSAKPVLLSKSPVQQHQPDRSIIKLGLV